MKDNSKNLKNIYYDVGLQDPTFLFMHGWLEDRTFWTPVINLLSKQHRCINLDLVQVAKEGTGSSLDPDSLAKSIEIFIDKIINRPVILVGHDLGGILALIANARSPENILGLVLIDPPLDGATNGAMTLLAKQIIDTELKDVVQPLFARWFLDSTPLWIQEKVKSSLSIYDQNVASEQFSKSEFLQEQMGRLIVEADKKPFMIIWPDNPSGSPEKLREITQFLRQEPIADTGHFLQLEKPAIVASLLRAFVDEIDRDPRITNLKDRLQGMGNTSDSIN